MNSFVFKITDKLLVVHENMILGFSTKDFRFLFRERMLDYVRDYAVNLKETIVMFLLKNGRVVEYDSENEDWCIAGELSLYNPQMHALSYGIRFDYRSGFLVSSPFDGKETVFTYDATLKRYTIKDTRVKSVYAYQSVLDRTNLMVYGADGQILGKLDRHCFSTLERPQKKYGEPCVTDYDPELLKGSDLYPFFRFACSVPDSKDILLTMIDGVALVRGVPDKPEIEKYVRFNNPLYAVWSPYDKKYFVVKSIRGELYLYVNFHEIMQKTDVLAYTFLDANTFCYLDDCGIHIMDLEKELELYLLPLNKAESSSGWFSYDNWTISPY